ncbi:MAG: NAD-dependent epimerase/dehydratase family protein [Rhodanobacter sp.]
MKIVVTGANGYIGRRLVDLAVNQGHQVIAASRQSLGRDAWLSYDLLDPQAFLLPVDTDAIIHLAAQTGLADAADDELEVGAATDLLAQAMACGSRVLFVSSQSASVDAPTSYGRIKWRIEQRVVAAGGIAIRPGQVYGGDERGLFGTLTQSVRRLPVLPAFVPAPLIQPIHVDDLVLGLLQLVTAAEILPGVVQLGAEKPVTFTRFLRQISKQRIRRFRLFFPVPVVVLKAARRLAGARTWQRLGLDRLDSLFALQPMSTSADLQRLQIEMRPLASGMHPSGDARRRWMLQEGRLVLRYLLKRPPGSMLLRRYVRAVVALRGEQPCRLPWWVARWPATLALLDDPKRLIKRMPELATRLDMALMLAEASTEGAERFLAGQPHGGGLGNLLVMSGAVVTEVIWRPIRWVYAILKPVAVSNQEARP